MSNDASEIVVGANGRVLVADPDNVSAWPEDVVTGSGDTLDPSVWTEVGFVSEDGVTFTDGKNVNDINAWQAFYSVRKIVADKSSKVEFVMRQWDGATIALAFGGGQVDTSGSAGAAIYTPAAPGDLDHRAMVIEWVDGDATYRLVLPNGIVTGEVSTKLTRTEAADLPVAFEVTPAGTPTEGDLSSQPWYIVTDADQFLGS